MDDLGVPLFPETPISNSSIYRIFTRTRPDSQAASCTTFRLDTTLSMSKGTFHKPPKSSKDPRMLFLCSVVRVCVCVWGLRVGGDLEDSNTKQKHKYHRITKMIIMIPNIDTKWYEFCTPAKSQQHNLRNPNFSTASWYILFQKLADLRSQEANFSQKNTDFAIERLSQSTLPETNIAPENKPSQKERIVFQPSICRCELLVSGRVSLLTPWKFNAGPRCPRVNQLLKLHVSCVSKWRTFMGLDGVGVVNLIN